MKLYEGHATEGHGRSFLIWEQLHVAFTMSNFVIDLRSIYSHSITYLAPRVRIQED
jgi:hypothetical protein